MRFFLRPTCHPILKLSVLILPFLVTNGRSLDRDCFACLRLWDLKLFFDKGNGLSLSRKAYHFFSFTALWISILRAWLSHNLLKTGILLLKNLELTELINFHVRGTFFLVVLGLLMDTKFRQTFLGYSPKSTRFRVLIICSSVFFLVSFVPLIFAINVSVRAG
jgi:hypothetical protein